MIGGLFSGHDENGGVTIEDSVIDASSGERKIIEKYKYFYGMSSKHAMEKYGNGKMKQYRSSEGDVLKIKYKGQIEETLYDLLGGIRNVCSYVNAKNIGELKENIRFVCSK